jgi:hypothetical protein
MQEIVHKDEIEFLRLLLKTDANLALERKHSSKTKIAKKDFTDYVEDIAKLRQMLGNLENDPKRNKNDIDLVEYRNRLSYLDATLDDLEVEQMQPMAEISMIPPKVEPIVAPTEPGI